MESIADPSERPCDSCLSPSNDLVEMADDALCPNCTALFSAATVLFDNGITEENEVMPTLAAACTLIRPNDLAVLTRSDEAYPGLELVKVIDDIPVIRVLPMVIEPVKYPGTNLLKQVRIKVHSKWVKSAMVQRCYKELLQKEGVRWGENNRGVISYSYQFQGYYLEIVVETGAEYDPILAAFEDPAREVQNPFTWPLYQFPSPVLVAGIYSSLLGSVKSSKGNGFAGWLDLYGKPSGKSAQKVIPAFVAWYIGSKAGRGVPTKDRPRIAKLLNKHLLRPCGQPELIEISWVNDDTVWRDVRSLLLRFVRLWLPFLEMHRRGA
jgi:hypothetical protein